MLIKNNLYVEGEISTEVAALFEKDGIYLPPTPFVYTGGDLICPKEFRRFYLSPAERQNYAHLFAEEDFQNEISGRFSELLPFQERSSGNLGTISCGNITYGVRFAVKNFGRYRGFLPAGKTLVGCSGGVCTSPKEVAEVYALFDGASYFLDLRMEDVR